ncbi:MAG: prepilin-type N-terminal cleavage/methylation domain-containing protein [Actinomycetota bacterium]|nr:prepilin-type N-terminal cleavage/methylation domain-containing protein [Actinomycetota bacterium]
MRNRLRGTVTADDAGFTLIELIVAMGIFSLLMAIVTTLFIRGIQTIQVAEQSSATQIQQQNAMEWMSRLLRYADNPVEGPTPPEAITEATTTAMTFTTYSGTGPVDRIPYKVRLLNTLSGITSQVWTPDFASGAAVLTNGVPTYASSANTRVLVQVEGNQLPSLHFQYWTTVNGVSTIVAPAADGTLTALQRDSLSKVELLITDSSSAQTLDQTVYLVNER